jgi:hypothetical protein
MPKQLVSTVILLIFKPPVQEGHQPFRLNSSMAAGEPCRQEKTKGEAPVANL